MTDDEKIVSIIQNASSHLHVGSYKLAGFLKGSLAKDIQPYRNIAGFGGLYWLSLAQIHAIIEYLVKRGYLQKVKVRSAQHSYEILKSAKTDYTNISLKSVQIKTKKLGESHNITLALFQRGYSPKMIAQKRGLKLSTIYAQFSELVFHQKISIFKIIDEQTVKKVGTEFYDDIRAKDLAQLFPDIEYPILCIILAHFRMRRENNSM